MTTCSASSGPTFVIWVELERPIAVFRVEAQHAEIEPDAVFDVLGGRGSTG